MDQLFGLQHRSGTDPMIIFPLSICLFQKFFVPLRSISRKATKINYKL